MSVHHSSFLFVYGTLMRGSGHVMHQLIKRHCRYIDQAYLYGKLYEIGGYPGLVLSRSPSDKVFGEIYEMNDQHVLLSTLDDYEECSSSFPTPTEYQRRIVSTHLLDESIKSAWTYLYNWPVDEQNRIVSGRYL